MAPFSNISPHFGSVLRIYLGVKGTKVAYTLRGKVRGSTPKSLRKSDTTLVSSPNHSGFQPLYTWKTKTLVSGTAEMIQWLKALCCREPRFGSQHPYGC